MITGYDVSLGNNIVIAGLAIQVISLDSSSPPLCCSKSGSTNSRQQNRTTTPKCLGGRIWMDIMRWASCCSCGPASVLSTRWDTMGIIWLMNGCYYIFDNMPMLFAIVIFYFYYPSKLRCRRRMERLTVWTWFRFMPQRIENDGWYWDGEDLLLYSTCSSFWKWLPCNRIVSGQLPLSIHCPKFLHP